MGRIFPKFTRHDLDTAAVIFFAAFVSTLLKGGSASQSLLISAVGAGIGALAHTYLGKGV
jgi:hypothetical protein